MYTGELIYIEKNKNSKDLLFDLYVLASHFEIYELENAVTIYLEEIISIDNVCNILNFSQKSKLRESCLMFMDSNASKIIEQKKYRELRDERLVDLFKRDSFDVAEKEIYTAVKDWHAHNKKNYIPSVVECIRFQFIEEQFIRSSDIEKSGMLTLQRYNEILRNVSMNSNSFCRGTLNADNNLALESMGAELIEGEENKQGLLQDEDNEDYEYIAENEKFTCHSISEDNSKSILIGLEKTFIINHIELRLWDFNER